MSVEPKGDPNRMTRPLVAVLALLALLVAAGCGEKEDALEPKGSKQVELLLDFFPNADHAGIYAAQADGYFKEAGLDVKIRKPADPSAPIKDVAAGRVDLAISYEPEVLRARDKGLHVIAVGALINKPLTSIIYPAALADPETARPGASGSAPRGSTTRRLPEHDPERRRGEPQLRQAAERGASTSTRRC